MIERLKEMSKIADMAADTRGLVGLSYEDSIHEATGKTITTYILIVERANKDQGGADEKCYYG